MIKHSGYHTPEGVSAKGERGPEPPHLNVKVCFCLGVERLACQPSIPGTGQLLRI